MSKKKSNGESPNQPLPASRSGTSIRVNLYEAYQAAFRPMVLANYLVGLRQNLYSPEELKNLTEIVTLALKLHLPLPRGYQGDPVAIKRLGMFKAEASIAHIYPILEAMRKRMNIPNPQEKEIPAWMIRSVQPKETKIQRIR